MEIKLYAFVKKSHAQTAVELARQIQQCIKGSEVGNELPALFAYIT